MDYVFLLLILHSLLSLSLSQDEAVELVTQLKGEVLNEHIYEELKCDANKIVKQ